MKHAKSSTTLATAMTFAAALLLLSVSVSQAYDAQIGWRPVSGASGYKVYVGLDGGAFGPAINVGKPVAESDGVIRVYVQALALGPDIRFAVSAFDGSGTEGTKSNQLVITYAEVAGVLDSDGDGLKDAQEDKNLDAVVNGGETDPQDADSDNDGLKDGAEVNTYKTNPLDADSDNDGLTDKDEITAGTDPKDPNDPGSPDGVCGNGRVETGEECDDGNSSNDDGCLANCKDAECIPGQGGCGDGNSCTTDTCEQGLCVSTNNTANCDDGIACTTNDRCSAGSCAGADSCGGGKRCNLETGQCKAGNALKGRWLPAATYPASLFYGDMTAGVQYASGTDSDVSADSIAPLLVYADTTSSSLESGSGDETIYTVNLPEDATWYLWGRMYYPGTASPDANSFFVRIDDRAAVKFGNNTDVYRQWHWDGDGNVDTGIGRPLVLGALAAGSHTIVVEKREAGGSESPRLDILFLTTDPAAVPTDQDAEVALAVCPQGVCEGEPGEQLCGDATGDGKLSVIDAWSILTASISIAEVCGMGVCDVDSSDAVNATDALIALRAAVGVGVEDLVCAPTVAFHVSGASKLTSIAFAVDYSNADVSFAVGSGGVICLPARPRVTAEVTVDNDPSSRQLNVAVDFSEPVNGELEVVECRFEGADGLPIPAQFSIALGAWARVGGRTTATTPTVAPTVILP